MIVIDAEIRQSPIHGLGLFAKQFIPKGAVIWVMHKGFDTVHTEEDIAKLPAPSRRTLQFYGYKSKKYDGRVVLCGDGGRHMNHSGTPNTTGSPITPEVRGQFSEEFWAMVDTDEDVSVALRDIQPGEELTCDYLDEFHAEDSNSVFLLSNQNKS